VPPFWVMAHEAGVNWVGLGCSSLVRRDRQSDAGQRTVICLSSPDAPRPGRRARDRRPARSAVLCGRVVDHAGLGGSAPHPACRWQSPGPGSPVGRDEPAASPPFAPTLRGSVDGPLPRLRGPWRHVNPGNAWVVQPRQVGRCYRTPGGGHRRFQAAARLRELPGRGQPGDRRAVHGQHVGQRGVRDQTATRSARRPHDADPRAREDRNFGDLQGEPDGLTTPEDCPPPPSRPHQPAPLGAPR
jgi:hypothetical protein